jgi:plasmid stabilization system protein ParE
VNESLPVAISAVAAGQIRAAEAWWSVHRTKAPHAIREELERAAALLAIQPELGAGARNMALRGVRRLHLARIRYDLYYRVVEEPPGLEILAFWHASRGSRPPV